MKIGWYIAGLCIGTGLCIGLELSNHYIILCCFSKFLENNRTN